jgi:hypothetical protein
MRRHRAKTAKIAISKKAADLRGRSFRVHLLDEISKFGSGMRHIKCLSYGPKWVRVEYPSADVRVRVKRSIFDPIVNHNTTKEMI